MYKHKPQPKPIESSRQKFVKNGLRAVARSESYQFRSSADSIPISEEMLSIQSSKTLCFAKPDNFWSDRYSTLAAPMGAEMYLNCERSMPETIMGGPRYYMKEVLDGREPVARPRFPYDDTAHSAAKTVTAQYKKNLRLRHEAAETIQKIWRGYRVFVEYLPIFIQRADAAGKIHDEYRGRKFSLLTNLRRRTELKRLSLLPPPRAPALSKEEVDRRYREKLAMKLTRFMKMIPKLLRKQRGRRKRVAIHATRVQSLYRGNKARERVWKMISAQILIACVHRRHFKRKYTKYILKIQRTYRNFLLKGMVILIQKHCRGFVHRRRAYKVKLKIASEERLRFTLERTLLKECIKTAAQSFYSLHGLEIKAGKIRKWRKKMTGKVVDPAPASHVYHTLSPNMLFFDPVEISAIRNHLLSVTEVWPKPALKVEGDEDEVAPPRVGAIREKITSVLSRYEYKKGRYIEESTTVQAKPEEDDVVPDGEDMAPASKGDVKSGKSGRGVPSKKPGSANTGKFSSGPRTPGSAKTPSSKKSVGSVKSPAPPKTPTSANAGARSGTSGKTVSAKSQRTPTSKNGSQKQSSSKKGSSSGKSNATTSFKSPGEKSSLKNVSHDDWAPGSIDVGSDADVLKSNNPDDYYSKKEKLMWLLLDSFTNWKYPRIDGFALLICQEYLEKRKSDDALQDRPLFRKLMPCGLSSAPQISAQKIYSEVQTPSNVSNNDISLDKTVGAEPLSESAPVADPSGGFPPGATPDSVTRLGLDTIDCEGGDDYQIDVLPVDNWGMVSPPSPQGKVTEDDNDFGWSPPKDSCAKNALPISPRDPGTSSKQENVFDATTKNFPNSSTKLEKSSSKLVLFMGSKKTVPHSNTPRVEGKSTVKSSVKVLSGKASPEVVYSVKKSEKELVKIKKKSNKFQSFDSPQKSSSKFSDISETLRPTSSSKSSPQRSSQKSKYAEMSIKNMNMKATKASSEKTVLSNSKKSSMSDLIIPEKQEAIKERVKFVLPDIVPLSPRCTREIPSGGFSPELDLFRSWDRYSIFSAYFPTKKVQVSIDFWKTVPDAVVAKAIFVRKWTLYFHNIFKIFIEKHRVRNPPRRYCPRCLMPSYVDIPRNHECSSEAFPLNWVWKNTWDPAFDVLVVGCSLLSESKFDKRLWKQINTTGAPDED